MSLVQFHRFLIACAILFCLGYAGWEVRAFVESGSIGSLTLAVVFGGLALLLGGYLWQLGRWLGYREGERKP